MRPALNPHPQYAFPTKLAFAVASALLLGKTRSFRQDAIQWVKNINPPLDIRGAGNIPPSAPFMLTINHYSRPGFNAAWIAIAASAAVPVEIHWLTTSAWTFPGRRLARPSRRISEWVFRRLSVVYGFTPMPPMPPNPDEAQARAMAVRRALGYARLTPNPAIGLAPEGRDTPGGALCPPPPGVGRFAAWLLSHCQRVAPVGFYEEGGCLCLQFGEPYALELPPGLDREQIDRRASQVIMAAIARELPTRLRGDYG